MLLAACGSATPAAPTEAPAADTGSETAAEPTTAPAATSDGPFKVAFVLPSPVTDLAWGQAMYDALKTVQTQMGGESAMEIAYSDNMFQVADAAAAIRDYATEGYNLVIAHGTQYGNSMFDVARDFPETSFAWGTATDTGESAGLNNVFAYEADAQEGGYVNGVIAALLSQSDVLGVVGPVEAGDAKLYIDGFVNGAKATKPDINVGVSYTGSFGDTALAAEAASTHISAGADVLTGSAQQVVGAIGVAKDKDVYWLGTQSDQSSLAPEVVVATQVFDWVDVVNDMIALHNAGTYGGKAYTLTLANDGLKMVFNPEVQIPDDVMAAAQQAMQDIKDGKIDPLPAQ
ncbi:MAG: BMP family protein [Caldilineae bacterium]|nr:BMP family protein [Anaerolineae bacterium]MCB0252759.1 BMP family protein [Anaerolineae bacterium]MCB9153223.1 BMP family protein [Caldilineae bacterium]